MRCYAHERGAQRKYHADPDILRKRWSNLTTRHAKISTLLSALYFASVLRFRERMSLALSLYYAK